MLHGLLDALISTGELTLIDPAGRVHRFGRGGGPRVTVRLHDPSLPRRLLLNPTLHAGEAYMDGTLTIEEGTLEDLLRLCTDGTDALARHPIQALRRWAEWPLRYLQQWNPVRSARANVAHHYDLSGALYDLFLDADRQYSCAYFRDGTETLEQAQQKKKQHIAAKLLLRPGQRVLDIGSGWGGLALELARSAQVDVTGLTLSEEQLAVAQSRVVVEELQDRARFLLRDYREVQGHYDRIVSVGMFEHVGVNHYHTFFNKLRDLLKPDGVALLHAIGCMEPPGAANPWIRKHIFPGGYCPSLSEVMAAIECSRLWVTDIEILRLHYADTLKEWLRRFRANRDKAAALYDERFCRMWEFYLASCEAGFRYGTLMVFQIQLARRRDAVPLTRDYLGIA